MIKKLIKRRFPGTKYLSHTYCNDILILNIRSTQKTAVCPYCGFYSSKVHSQHIRKFNDLPYKGYQVTVCLHHKKFFCKNKACKHTTFVEGFAFISPSEKKTDRLINEIIFISNGNSSRKATSYLKATGINVCKATVCNLKNKYS